MSLLVLTALAQAVVPTVDLPLERREPCAGYGTALASKGDTASTVTLDDQVRMADIGRSAAGPAPNAFGLSPDGTHVAVRVKRANPEANGYCLVLLVVRADGFGEPVEIDRGGDFIRDDFELRNFSVTMAGWDRPNPPRWSPDGKHVAYLKREKGTTQVWLADPSGHAHARQASALPDDADSFAWTPDGAGLVVATRPGIRAELAAIENEGLRGFLFDDRFGPQFADHPLPTRNMASAYTWVSLTDGRTRRATADEIALLVPSHSGGVPQNSRLFRSSPDGHAAWLEPKSPAHLLSPTRLIVASPDRRRAVCESKQCEGVRGLWWSPADRSFFILQNLGWAKSQTGLLRWDAGDAAPRQIVVTNDVILGCEAAGGELVCAREGATQPRRIVAIDMRTGRERIVHDPNPEFQRKRFGKIERFRFRNAYGVESFADLVLPPDHKPGQRHPLVIVQYGSEGFLRGGTGDEVPIQPLAARGFAVLSFDRPDLLPEAYRATTEAEMRTLNSDPWADRRQVHSSLEMAIDRAVATGAVDANKVGISGFSDGSSTVQFALLNSDRFKAASISSCCEDMYSFALAAGPYFTDSLREVRYRYFENDMETFWEPMSLIHNADKLDVPILVQNADSEYEGGLDVIEALTHHGKAIELYVFPGEPHFKWQPAHRRAIYERNIEWFEFWLMGKINCDPKRAEQYRRWKAMPGAPAEHSLQCVAPSAGP